ncbi:MAG: hypothetical protein ACRDZN_14320 [Acidimicrobiales bacterium]
MSVYYRGVAAERSDHVVQAGRTPTRRMRWGVRLGAAVAGAAVALAVPLSQEETLFVGWRDWVPAACFVVVVAAPVVAWVPVGRVRQHRVPSRPAAKGAR